MAGAGGKTANIHFFNAIAKTANILYIINSRCFPIGRRGAYLHMVGCRESNFVQQGAGNWTGCRAGCRTPGRTGCRTRLWSRSFGRKLLHVSWLQSVCSNLVSITAHEAQGCGWPLTGTSLAVCMSPVVVTGS